MKKIIIVGAGISGLYLANLIQKYGNYDYQIFEKRPDLNMKDGYGIQISVNGIKLLNNIGFKNTPVHDVYFPRNIKFYNAKNCKLIAQIDISRYNKKGCFYTTLKRSVLINFLKQNIPSNKISFNSDIKNIHHENNIKIIANEKTWDTDKLVISDGVFSSSKKMVIQKLDKINFYNSVALRGNIKNINDKDISIYLGPKFHFVIYPINQDGEFNFISIIREKNLNKINDFSNLRLIDDFTKYIYSNTSYKLKDKLQNISIYPVYASKKINIPKNKNIYLTGDALFAFPPSFAQGASQSIESSFELFKNLEEDSKKYYMDREIRVNKIRFRSEFNHYAFHVSDPFSRLARDIALKYLCKNKIFLENYLGKIYNN